MDSGVQWTGPLCVQYYNIIYIILCLKKHLLWSSHLILTLCQFNKHKLSNCLGSVLDSGDAKINKTRSVV